MSLNKDVTIQLKTREDANIFKKFYSELYPNLVKKLSIAPNKFNKGTTKDCCTGTFNNNIIALCKYCFGEHEISIHQYVSFRKFPSHNVERLQSRYD